MLNVLNFFFRFYRNILVVAVASINENDTDNITFTVANSVRLGQALNLTILIIFTKPILAEEWLEDIWFVKCTAQLDNNVVLLESIYKVLGESVEKDLQLRLHAPTDRITEDQKLRLAAEEARLNHELLMHKARIKHFEEPQLLNDPRNHRLSTFGLHHFNGSCNLQQLRELIQCLALQDVEINRGELW